MNYDRLLWAIALLAFVVGDLATTAIGLNYPTLVEANPAVLAYAGSAIVAGTLLAKAIVIAIGVVIWKHAPYWSRYAGPVAILFVGAAITVNNTAQILAVA